jgi:hypothetical protein
MVECFEHGRLRGFSPIRGIHNAWVLLSLLNFRSQEQCTLTGCMNVSQRLGHERARCLLFKCIIYILWEFILFWCGYVKSHFVSKNWSTYIASSWTIAILRYDVILPPRHQYGEYSSIKQNFLSYVFIFCKPFYSVSSGLKIIGHGNPENNLESHCIIYYIKKTVCVWLFVTDILGRWRYTSALKFHWRVYRLAPPTMSPPYRGGGVWVLPRPWELCRR